MNLGKRITLTSSVILVFFFFTIIVFLWSNKISREKVNQLQSVIRTQYLVGDISQQMESLNKRLKILDTVALAQNKKMLSGNELENLHKGIVETGKAITAVRQVAGETITRDLVGIDTAKDIINEWESIIENARSADQPVPLYTLVSFSSRFDEAEKQLTLNGSHLRSLSSELNQDIDKAEALIQKVSLFVFLLSAIIALALTTFLIRYTQSSLTRLRKGTREWSRGNLSHRIKISGKGDLSELGNACNAMADHAEKAVACAIEMEQAMIRVNELNQAAGLPEISTGIGINTGEVIVGNIGSEKRAKYGVVGHHVNFTARVESYTAGGQILISERTRDACNGLVLTRGEMSVRPKGIDEEVRIFDVSGMAAPYNLEL